MPFTERSKQKVIELVLTGTERDAEGFDAAWNRLAGVDEGADIVNCLALVAMMPVAAMAHGLGLLRLTPEQAKTVAVDMLEDLQVWYPHPVDGAALGEVLGSLTGIQGNPSTPQSERNLCKCLLASWFLRQNEESRETRETALKEAVSRVEKRYDDRTAAKDHT